MEFKVNRVICRAVMCAALVISPWLAAHQPDYQQAEITATELSAGIYMLTGIGGNVGLSVGDDGAFLVDDELAPMTDKLLAAVASLTDQPVRFVVNTHWHFDHVGGNSAIGNSGAVIVAQENVRQRMARGQFMEVFQMEVPPAERHALPVVTFGDSVSFHWNDDRIDLIHTAAAHTDGDAVVFFHKANVVHTGDLFWNGIYPLIDSQSGGSIGGMIAGVERVLSMTDSETQIIPGHGPLSNRHQLQEYHALLETAQRRIARSYLAGKSVEEVVAARPTAEFDAKWGGGTIPPDNWVAMVYASIANQ